MSWGFIVSMAKSSTNLREGRAALMHWALLTSTISIHYCRQIFPALYLDELQLSRVAASCWPFGMLMSLLYISHPPQPCSVSQEHVENHRWVQWAPEGNLAGWIRYCQRESLMKFEPTKTEHDNPSLNFISSENRNFYTFWAHDTPDTYATHCIISLLNIISKRWTSRYSVKYLSGKFVKELLENKRNTNQMHSETQGLLSFKLISFNGS